MGMRRFLSSTSNIVMQNILIDKYEHHVVSPKTKKRNLRDIVVTVSAGRPHGLGGPMAMPGGRNKTESK